MFRTDFKTSACTALLASILAVTSAVGTAQAQASATATANATATILGGLALTWVEDLNFNDLIPGTTPGTINMVADGSANTVIVTGGVLWLGPRQTAVFLASGTPNRQITATVSPASIQISNGTDFMTVDTWSVFPPVPIFLGPLGNMQINVGGMLHVPAAQPSGFYTGVFTLTVAYS